MKSSASLDWWAKILTAFMFGVVAFLIYQIITVNEVQNAVGLGFGILVLGATMVWCYLLSIKQYVINQNTLIIKRTRREKTYDLNLLTSVVDYKQVKKGITWRTMGNGGLFGYFGSFTNSGIGDFSMYATKQKPLWILTLGKEKIAISPDEHRFIEALQARVKPSI